jgi:hypothetical protein
MDSVTYSSGFDDYETNEWMWGFHYNEEQSSTFTNFMAMMSRNAETNQVRGNPKSISSALYNTIPSTDVRSAIFDPTGNHLNLPAGVSLVSNHSKFPYTHQKFLTYDAVGNRGDVPLMRASEMYLIEAEALAKKATPDFAGAAAALFTLAKARDASYVLSTKTGQDLIDEIDLQRRWELWGEGFRFADLKRRRQLLVEWAGETTGYPRDASVPGLFREVAAARPDAIAVADGDLALSYAELDRRSRRLAALFRARGVGPEVPVALLLERSADQVTATLAVLRAGGYYVPLEPGYPGERLVRTLAEAKTPLLVSEGTRGDELAVGLSGTGGSWSGTVLRLEDALAAGEVGSHDGAGWRDVDVAPEGLCYVMYTSGSTGRPKGVAVPHRGVARLVREPDFMTTGPGETFLELAPTAFDASTLEIWGPLHPVIAYVLTTIS